MNNNGTYMTKMDMVWIAVASCIYPDVRSGRTVSKKAIDDKVKQLFEVEISPAMINQHLVGSVDRQARKGGYGGGSRNRYLSKGENGGGCDSPLQERRRAGRSALTTAGR